MSVLSLYSINCQNFRAYLFDIKVSVLKTSSLLILFATHTDDDEPLHIPNFDCIVHYERRNVSHAGVAIYQNFNFTHIISSYMDVHVKNTNAFSMNRDEIGEICIR